VLFSFSSKVKRLTRAVALARGSSIPCQSGHQSLLKGSRTSRSITNSRVAQRAVLTIGKSALCLSVCSNSKSRQRSQTNQRSHSCCSTDGLTQRPNVATALVLYTSRKGYIMTSPMVKIVRCTGSQALVRHQNWQNRCQEWISRAENRLQQTCTAGRRSRTVSWSISGSTIGHDGERIDLDIACLDVYQGRVNCRDHDLSPHGEALLLMFWPLRAAVAAREEPLSLCDEFQTAMT